MKIQRTLLAVTALLSLITIECAAVVRSCPCPMMQMHQQALNPAERIQILEDTIAEAKKEIKDLKKKDKKKGDLSYETPEPQPLPMMRYKS